MSAGTATRVTIRMAKLAITRMATAMTVLAVTVADLPKPPKGVDDDVEIALEGDRCQS
jgi:hypothetical protein